MEKNKARYKSKKTAPKEKPGATEEKYKNLVENLGELIYCADAERFFATYVNNAVERLYGYTPEEWLRDRTLRERSVYPEDKKKVLAELAEARKSVKSVALEYRIIKKDQSVLWVADHISWEKDTQGNPIAMAGVMYDITPRKKAEEALRISQETLKSFSKKILLLHEDEKKKISRDLHDETGQIVISLGAALNIIEKELKEGNIQKSIELLSENRNLIQEIASKMKQTAVTLRPPALDILGLPAVLREYFSQCTKSSPLAVEFNENLKDVKLNDDIEITLYRIIQEAIYNIIKHAEATKVKVDLIFTEKELRLRIEDNGKGFDVEDYRNSSDITKMGLRSIKERADILNGVLSVNSNLDSGTRLTVVLPLDYTMWQPV